MDPSQTKILIFGLPGSGKTTLATALAPLIRAVVFNGDDVRAPWSHDLGFSLQDRIEQAKRMQWLCDRVALAGHYVIADFVCPTEATRNVFGPCFKIFVDRISSSRFPDTDAIFEPPRSTDLRIKAEGNPDLWAHRIADILVSRR